MRQTHARMEECAWMDLTHTLATVQKATMELTAKSVSVCKLIIIIIKVRVGTVYVNFACSLHNLCKRSGARACKKMTILALISNSSVILP